MDKSLSFSTEFTYSDLDVNMSIPVGISSTPSVSDLDIFKFAIGILNNANQLDYSPFGTGGFRYKTVVEDKDIIIPCSYFYSKTEDEFQVFVNFPVIVKVVSQKGVVAHGISFYVGTALRPEDVNFWGSIHIEKPHYYKSDNVPMGPIQG